MNSSKVTSSLYLIAQPVLTPHKVEKVVTNHIWIYDRSGSMYATLPELCTHMKVLVRHLPVGDTITLMWFSGKGEHGTILKGCRLSNMDDFLVVDRAIDANNTTLSTTCFSEVLSDLIYTITDLRAFSDRFAVTLFTDGHPVVSNISNELSSINQAIDLIRDQITAMLLIGYGDHYNRDLMCEMAQRVNGSCLHSNDLKEWGMSITKFIESNSKPRHTVIPVVPPESIHTLFTIRNDTIVQLNPALTVDILEDTLYILSTEAVGNVMPISNQDEMLVRGYLGAAIALNQRMNSDMAIEILGNLGDKYLIDVLRNAYTNDEYGRAEREISAAIHDSARRFINGCDTSYLPSVDAVCLLDVLSVLMDDKDTYFYPYHPSFEYKRIGRSHLAQSGYSKFIATENIDVPFNSLTWHQSKLNLSVLAKIPGTITLLDQDKVTAGSLGLSTEFPTFIWRNYTFVKDGILNVKKVPVKLGGSSYIYLSKLNLIENPNAIDGIYILDLTRIPIINQQIAKNNTSAKSLATDIMKKLRLECHIKVLKDKVKPLTHEPTNLSERMTKFLEQNGIRKDGAFSPPVVKLEKSSDFYLAKSFLIKVKGASYIPKVSDLRTKKLFTIPARFMYEVLDVPKDLAVTLLEQKTREVKELRRQIQTTKFGIMLTKKWFKEFKSRNDCDINYTDKLGEVNINTVVSFIVKEEKVYV